MNWEQLKLGREEHGFICGATGGGKSVLAQFLVNDPDKPHSVVYDPKHSRTLGEWRNQTIVYSSFNDPRDARFGLPIQLVECDAPRILYRPSLEEAEDRGQQEAFFRWVYWREHCRVYVDECSALLGDSAPNQYLKGCLTRGRELGISTLCATQRPVSIPLITMSEASRFYIFRLNLEEDRRRIAKITGISDEEQLTLRRYEFFYFDMAGQRSSQKLTLDLSSLQREVRSNGNIAKHAARQTAVNSV
jgi:hypothetical protein